MVPEERKWVYHSTKELTPQYCEMTLAGKVCPSCLTIIRLIYILDATVWNLVDVMPEEKLVEYSENFYLSLDAWILITFYRDEWSSSVANTVRVDPWNGLYLFKFRHIFNCNSIFLIYIYISKKKYSLLKSMSIFLFRFSMLSIEKKHWLRKGEMTQWHCIV